jgi:hypothetical protein
LASPFAEYGAVIGHTIVRFSFHADHGHVQDLVIARVAADPLDGDAQVPHNRYPIVVPETRDSRC